MFWNADGTEKLTGSRLDRAKLTYLNAPDGNTDDNEWYGWSIDRPNTYAVTIRVKLNGNPWTDHNKTFALREDGDTEFITDLAHVSNGTYSIFDITGVSADALSAMARDVAMDTNVDVTVQDDNAEAEVNYYTATFYDRDAADNEVEYGTDTDQRPQIILSGRKVARPDSNPTEPKDPGKAGWLFDVWKTEDGGDYNFETGIGEKQKIYASWRRADDPVKTYIIDASATEGGSISPDGKISVNEGDNKTFTITPKEGYRIKSVLVNGTDRKGQLTDGKNYTFTNILQSYTIVAEFERDGGENPDPNPNPGGDNTNPGGDNPGGSSGGGGGNSGGGSGGSDDGMGDHGGNGGSGGNTGDNGGNGGGDTNSGNGGGAVNAVNSDSGNSAGNEQAAASAGNVSAQAQAQSGGSGTSANGKEPKTGDASYLEVYATLAMIAGLTYLILYMLEESRGMSEREKEAFIAAFIRWGKKGGAFRKGCAMAAIFCLLAYYHTIGKRAWENALREKYLGQAV